MAFLVQRPVASAPALKPSSPPPPKPVATPLSTTSTRSHFSDGMMSDRMSQVRSQAHLLGGSSPALFQKVDPPPQSWPIGPLGPGQEPRPEVATMQNRLIEFGYLTKDQIQGYSGVYGPKTTNAVREFQIANGILPANGVADRQTLAIMGAPSALSLSAAMSNLAGSGETIISPSIGTAGPSPVPTMSTLDQGPLTASIRGNPANVRPDPSTNQKAVGQFTYGTPVTVDDPQPGGGADGWLHVSGTGQDGQPLEGWVANGWNGNDLVGDPSRSGDPRVQDRMEALGYVPPDGAVDEDAINDFQLMNGLDPTGQLDDATLQAMWSADARVSTHLTQVKDATWNHSTTLGSSNDCGPASVAMALAAAGIKPIDNAHPDAAIQDARDAAGGGHGTKTGPDDLVDAVIDGGGQAYRLKDLDEVKLAVSQGDPVVLFGNSYGGHWVTVVGYDPASNTFLVSDPMSHDGVQRWDSTRMAAYANFSQDAIGVHNPNS